MNINMTLIGQSITFLVFVWFCMQFVWPVIRKAMDERTQRITDGLSAAERAQKDLTLAQDKAAITQAEQNLASARLQVVSSNSQASNDPKIPPSVPRSFLMVCHRAVSSLAITAPAITS